MRELIEGELSQPHKVILPVVESIAGIASREQIYT